MNFKRRVELAARAVVQSARFVMGAKATPFMFPVWSMADDRGIASLIDYETYADEGYGQNAIVHACIREISRSAPSAKLQVQRRLKNAQSEVWEDHPLQRVLNRPNPHQSRVAFLELYYSYLNVDGNAFILRERKGGRTEAMWLPRPDRMRPVVAAEDGKLSLLGYVYVSDDGKRLPFLPEDVIHIKEPNPADPYEGLGRGMAPLAAAAVETDVDNRATKFMKKFFDNAAVPFGLLKSKNQLSDSEVGRIRARIKEQYSGERNWHEIMILDADAEYQRMGLDLEQMAFTDLRAISETRTCAVFKVPPILIGVKAGLDASTYSNYTQARRAMWEDKIIPDNTKLAEELNAAFADELGADGVIGHDYSQVVALQEDRNSRFDRANQGVNGGWITVNEARREVGLAPVGNGDVFLRPLMSQQQSAGKNLSPGPSPKRRGDIRHAGEGEEERKSKEELGAAIQKRRDRVSRAWEMRFLDGAQEQLKREAREVEAAIRKMKMKKSTPAEEKMQTWDAIEAAILAVVNGESRTAWQVSFLPLMRGLLDDQAEDEAEALGIDWNVDNPQVLAFLERYSLMFAQRISESTAEALRQMLLQARTEDWQITRLISEVGRLYDDWDFRRAEMIARSETMRASNAGAEQAYMLAGIEREEWYAAVDERTCPFCGEMHGKTIGVREMWFRQGDEMRVTDSDGNVRSLRMDYADVGYPPLHTDCRCTVLPVVEE